MGLVVLSVVEQRYQAVLEVVKDGRTVVEVAARYGVSRQTVHAWIRRWEAGGLGGLADPSHRPRDCPHQMSGEVEAKGLHAATVISRVGAASVALGAGAAWDRGVAFNVGDLPLSATPRAGGWPSSATSTRGLPPLGA